MRILSTAGLMDSILYIAYNGKTLTVQTFTSNTSCVTMTALFLLNATVYFNIYIMQSKPIILRQDFWYVREVYYPGFRGKEHIKVDYFHW